ncbi:MAG: ABC transporter permease [Saprospiraceae bacterium]|nr:ABC transporter permease [Saprospiraceae bacterium]
MLRHFITLSLRNFKRNRSTFLINLLGLSTGLACVILIYLWVSDERRIDHFHSTDERLYQVMNNLALPFDVLTLESTPYPMADALLEEMPEVEAAVAVNDFFTWRHREGIMSMGETKVETKGLYTTASFFEVFPFEILQGETQHLLQRKDEVILSNTLKDKLFPNLPNPIGQIIEFNHTTFSGKFKVAGVMEGPPANATWQFDFLLHFDVLLEQDPSGRQWTNNAAKTFVLLRKDTNLEEFNAKIANYINERNQFSNAFTPFVKRFSEKYLYGKYVSGIQSGGRIEYVKLFSIIAFIILLIACINFINLSTAQASMKGKEVGVKKTFGIGRAALIWQFLGESLLLTSMAVLVAVQLAYWLLPSFNHIAGKQLTFDITFNNILTLAAITLLTALLAGVYPAFYLSGFKPIEVLKSKINLSKSEVWIRKGLVIFQFTLSILFIVGLWVVRQQIDLAQTKNMGYDRDNVISFDWKGNLYDQWNGLLDGKSNENFYAFMRGLRDIPGVASVSNMSGNILNDIYGQTGISWSGQEEEKDVHFQSPLVGYDFIETLDIKVLQGRSFSEEMGDNYSKVIVNQSTVELMGLENPVGQIIGLNDGSEIVGVVEDFHYGSIRNAIEPLIFRCEQNGRNVLVRIKAGSEKATLERLKTHYEAFLPGYSFDFSFLDDDYQALYEAEQKVSSLSWYFACLAILISCLGLFGLATFTAERRKKEISIRRVLGASSIRIVKLLSKDFTQTVLVAILIALPLSYILAKNWLSSFATSIKLQPGIFIGSGAAVLLIAWLTVGFQTYQAARTSPIHALKED